MESSFEQLAEMVKDACEQVRQNFNDPEDDWMMAAFVDKGEEVVICPCTMDKHPFIDAVAAFAKRESARRVAVVASTWILKFEGDKDAKNVDNLTDALSDENRELLERIQNGELNISDCEDLRQENLIIVVVDHEVTKMHCAEILRDGENPPTLGQWDVMTNGMDGRMIEPLIAALR